MNEDVRETLEEPLATCRRFSPVKFSDSLIGVKAAVLNTVILNSKISNEHCVSTSFNYDSLSNCLGASA
ncbi:hypothetical protein CA13_44540 [Planctomycetes bacterium CA13]|uniref:Uncharacterized protein n=1 Tax=Novipirellula herctigrandis TaxID=2527986 RepID=A0A5C5Z832_9BACT|nr:hypothetical protein CA13_44540 [Planctomycetes bacterium CA13]